MATRQEDQMCECFLLAATGTIDRLEGLYGAASTEASFVRYSWVHGADWTVAAGLEQGISQRARAAPDGSATFNMPLDVTLKATNPFGWPQLVVSVYGRDLLGRDVIVGYCTGHIPAGRGTFRLRVRLQTPQSSSRLNHLSSLLSGRPPELLDQRMLCHGDARGLIRVRSNGQLVVTLNVTLKDFNKLHFRV